MPEPGYGTNSSTQSTGGYGGYGSYGGGYGGNSDNDSSTTDTSSLAGINALSDDTSKAEAHRSRPDTSILSGIEALSREPTAAQQLSQPSANDERIGLPSGLTGAGQGMLNAGTNTLVSNPALTKTWESTTSGWTNQGGFTSGAIDRLEAAGMNVERTVNPTPAGSVTRTPGVSPGSVTTHNGNLAEQAIADRYRAQGLTVNEQVQFDPNYNRVETRTADTTGHRFVDVEVEHPHPTDPRLNQVEHIESKAFRVNAGSIDPDQLAHDAGMLSRNRGLRTAGFALERVGRVARPVGLVVDTVDVVGAIRRDGGIGVETGRTVTGIAGGAAGGWGGAAAGAAIGTAIMPGVGTVIGGVVGGIAGAWGGENIATGAFDAVKGFFSW